MTTDKLTRITTDEAETLAQDWRNCDGFDSFLDTLYASGAQAYLNSTDTHFAIRLGSTVFEFLVDGLLIVAS